MIEDIIITICSHIRSVVATIGGQHGAAARDDRWRHLYSGFTVWLSQSEAKGNAFDFDFSFFPFPQLTKIFSLKYPSKLDIVLLE